MQKLTNFIGAGMGILLLTAVVAYAGDNKPKTPFPLNFDPGIFDKTSATIDNEWWPLKPGQQFTWEGSALEDGKKQRRKVVFTVTDMVKEIAGVRSMVTWDRDYQDGELTESELLFLAQDKDGNVWHLGESVEHYEDRPELNSREHYDGGRVWMVGYLEDCKAGIYMPAMPKLGDPQFSQGFAPHPWDWDDWAEVYQVGQKISVPAGSYSDVLVFREWEPAAPGISQLKYYARGVGTVRVGWLGEEDEEREELELTKLVTLTPKELADVRAAVIAHESRAYMYSLTPPAHIADEQIADDMSVNKITPIPIAYTEKRVQVNTDPVRKITNQQAREIALQAVPGKIIKVEVERKLGKKRLVVEMIADADMAETDVIIDMETGKVLATEN